VNSVPPVGLDPLYYLHNFQELLRCVEAQYQDLLTPEEQGFLAKFGALKTSEKALLVRMYSRRSTLFRSDKLNYPELPPLAEILVSLAASGFITLNHENPVVSLLALVTIPEMCQWWPQHCPRRGNREQLLAQLATLEEAEFYAAIPFQSVAILHQPLIDLFQLLFFGNSMQDLSTFVTVELGHVQYEDYRLDADTRLFTRREDIDHAVHLRTLRNQWYDMKAFDPEETLSILKRCPDLAPQSPSQGRLCRLCNRIGKAFEQRQMLDEAYRAYQRSTRAPARERCARIRFKQGRWEEARLICEHILQAPLNEAELLFAERFIKQCLKQLKQEAAKEKRFVPATQTVRIPPSELRVELAVSQHFQSLDAACVYVENWLFNAVFGLTFWDALFAPVKGAFTHPFQRGPHDLYDADFVQRRQPLIKQAASLINQPDWPLLLAERWQQKFGCSNSFVGWYEDGWAVIQQALGHIPRAHWQAIFQRMLSDLRENCSGFPDLIRFTADGHYELLEVKSPTDKLQANQSRWMKRFEKVGIPYQLIQVEWMITESIDTTGGTVCNTIDETSSEEIAEKVVAQKTGQNSGRMTDTDTSQKNL